MSTCPSSEILKQFIAATLSESQADEVLVHLESCTACAKRLRELEQLPDAMLTERGIAAGFRELRDRPFQVSSMLPPQVGKYEILEKIGEGGMGTVYRGRHPDLQKDVAVKVLKASRLDNPAARTRFAREVEAIGRMRHENIVQAIDAGLADGVPFIVMEFLDGSDLGEYVKQNGPLPMEQALSLIRQAARGLEHAHAAGLVHRDVKPSNLFLTRNGIVKILDLGIARPVSGENREKHTATGQIVGSPDFMAPEHFRGGTVDMRSDIYSLGCTLAYLLTAKSLSESHNDLPSNARPLVAKMTAGMPDQRFQSTDELIQAIDTLPMGRTLISVSYRSMAIGVMVLFLLYWGYRAFFARKPNQTEMPTSTVQTPIETERKPLTVPESVRKEAADNEALYKKTPQYQAYLKEKAAWEKDAAEHAKQLEAWKRDPRENPHPGPLESPPIPPERFASGAIP